MTEPGTPSEAGKNGEAFEGLRGLFDGFEGYLTPTEDDYRRVLAAGLVVPDTNVLLNLYRYHEQTQADLFAVLESLGNRLWVPNQVAVEFWRNRESALREPQRIAQDTVKALESLQQQVSQQIRTWSNQLAPPDEEADIVEMNIDMAFDELTELIGSFTNADHLEWARDTTTDPVLNRLVSLLENRVGEPFEPDEYESQIEEGLRRASDGAPPGYRDGHKSRDGNFTEGAAGDYLVWAQVLREAHRRCCDVLLVTGDVKDDWWRKDRGQLRGPRLELFDEMQAYAGVCLFMLRPESLLVHARHVLDVAIREESVQDVGRVDSAINAGESGWAVASIHELLDRLDREGPVQAAAMRAAAENDGFVSRETVYDLGGYDESRMLRGFTRPANRIAQELRDAEVVPESAVDVREAEYEAGSYAQACGFRIPDELVSLIGDRGHRGQPASYIALPPASGAE